MTDHQQVQTGRQAARELELTELAFRSTREALLEEMLKSDPTNRDLREAIFFQIRGLDAVRDRLLRTVDAGSAAALRITATEETDD